MEPNDDLERRAEEGDPASAEGPAPETHDSPVSGGGLDAIDVVNGADLLAFGATEAASGAADLASGAADLASGAADAVGGAVEALGSAAESAGSVLEGASGCLEGCAGCSLAVLFVLFAVGGAALAIMR